eukprot:CAMPEP_0114145994 /NCGR_PEP_ID=MMETSP0043_2-20121206/20335_1 /TAXON_ID=464988 /ORGANISM="Hemiselmis andersenii, Strain CCMP644" /LENGTH=123 /DNA_ID=CAMNT_0001240433 /DNA_START=150 /DNA_END=518 /DNA_ORIENTATION=+
MASGAAPGGYFGQGGNYPPPQHLAGHPALALKAMSRGGHPHPPHPERQQQPPQYYPQHQQHQPQHYPNGPTPAPLPASGGGGWHQVQQQSQQQHLSVQQQQPPAPGSPVPGLEGMYQQPVPLH